MSLLADQISLEVLLRRRHRFTFPTWRSSTPFKGGSQRGNHLCINGMRIIIRLHKCTRHEPEISTNLRYISYILRLLIFLHHNKAMVCSVPTKIKFGFLEDGSKVN